MLSTELLSLHLLLGLPIFLSLLYCLHAVLQVVAECALLSQLLFELLLLSTELLSPLVAEPADLSVLPPCIVAGRRSVCSSLSAVIQAAALCAALHKAFSPAAAPPGDPSPPSLAAAANYCSSLDAVAT